MNPNSTSTKKKRLSAVLETYTGINGPLANNALNFKNETYSRTELLEPTVQGIWWKSKDRRFLVVEKKPKSSSKVRIELAIKPEWNEATYFVEKVFPAGTIIFEGVAAPQNSITGGGNQVFILANLLQFRD